MIGAVLVVLALVVIGPFALFVGGMVWSALIGHLGSEDADIRYEGSEFVEQRLW